MKALFSYTIGAGLFVYSLLALVYTTYAIFSNVWPFNLSSGPRSFSPFVARNSRSSAVNFTLSPTDPSFVSRAFSNSMRPSSITPFYYKAANHFDDDDITITTLVTGNRFHVFAQLVSTYQGPVSATVHVSSTPISDRNMLLDELHELYISNPHMSKYVDIHLVLDPFERQFNLWRNIARFYARTDFVMMLDVDFALCTDFRSRILGSDQVMKKLKEGRMALVVPAFEFARQKDGLNATSFPTDKKALLALVKEKKIDMFHKSWKPGHGTTDFERYYASPPGQIYRVSGYQYSYEPYVIYKREGTPWCDARFVGYGANKAACLFELYISGVSFYVLADDFIIHQSHTYAEHVRKQERRYNAKVYAAFREEICLKYLAKFLLDGSINAERGYNVQEVCRQMPGVPKLASQLMSSLTGQTEHGV